MNHGMKIMAIYGLLGVAVCLTACSSGSDAPAYHSNSAPAVTLNDESGAPASQMVNGIKTTDSTGAELYKFLGIQYAAAPVDENRWRAPQPPQWTEIEATEFGARCPQGFGGDDMASDICEDCLFLNVWTPKLTPDGDGDLTVMVFIHGGAFLQGAGGSAKGDEPDHLNLYDGTRFIETARETGENIVFVTLNYRLGALGFLAGDKVGLGGNYGIQDQQKALQWVQRNIALFGGDPSRVMIFGESAGAQSTALHLTMPSSQPLFARAIMESDYAITYMSVKEAQQKVDAFAKLLGCSDQTDVLDCLRKTSVSDILDAQLLAVSLDMLKCAGLQAIIPWNPVIDGKLILENPIDAQIDKPIMIGSNLSESVPFIAPITEKDGLAQATYYLLMDVLFGINQASHIIATYDAQYPEATEKQKFEQVVTDYLWTCFNRKFATQPLADVYRYHYVHHGSFSIWVDKNGDAQGAIPEACAADGVVCHADELPFVFGNPANNQAKIKGFSADEADMSANLRRYWVQFARTGDPNVAGQTLWPLDVSGSLLKIQAPGTAIESIPDSAIADPAHCADIWDPIGYKVSSAFTCTQWQVDEDRAESDIP